MAQIFGTYAGGDNLTCDEFCTFLDDELGLEGHNHNAAKNYFMTISGGGDEVTEE